MAQDINVDFSNYYLGEATKDTIEDNGVPKSYGIAANFFIPFNMGLKMDGLSGMRLFDALSITNEVLPSLYTDSLVFIINGINHTITDAGWITSLSTQTFNQFNGTGDSPQLPTAEVTTRGEADLVDEFEGPTPNADFLRKYLKLYNIREKGKELSNGGDIDQALAWGSIVMFDRIRQNSNLTEDNIEIVVTGGNDAYHQNITEYKSNHTIGKSLDFTVNGTITLPNGKLRSARQLVKEWALQPLTKANKTFRFKDEYLNPVEKTTGGHFHIVYPTTGNEGLANQIKAENGSGVSYPIPPFSVYESFSYNGQTGPTYAEFLAERETNFNGAGTPSTNSTTKQK